jgi:hypothetical protein
VEISKIHKRGFGLVVRVAGWHASDPGSILSRDGLYIFGCISQRFESTLVEILCYVKTLIYFLEIYLFITL